MSQQSVAAPSCEVNLKISPRRQGTASARPAIMAAMAFALIWLFSLSRNLCDPIGNDEAAYQFLAEMTLDGHRDAVIGGHVKYAAALVMIRSLGIFLTGTSFIGIRLFDAFWQLATMGALAGLAIRDGRRWSVGFLAATLYTLGYYGMHHLNTGGRDSFVVLPMLLMLHAILSAHRANPGSWRAFSWYVAGGILGFCTYVLKFPYGLCYGLFWLWALAELRRWPTQRWRTMVPVAGLTVGFMIALLAWTTLMLAIGWWDSPWTLLSDDHPKGYTVGHWLMLDLMGGAAVAGMVTVAIPLYRTLTTSGSPDKPAMLAQPTTGWPAMPAWCAAVARMGIIAVAVYILLVSVREWNAWRGAILPFSGLLVPAAGAMMLSNWRSRTPAWRIVAMAALATLAVIVLQGRFWLYHFFPLFACLAYLGAVEVGSLLREINTLSAARQAWLAICLGALMQMGIGHWWQTMTLNGYRLDACGGLPLAVHYDRMCATRNFVPAYTTIRRVANRIQQLTGPDDPISCLFLDARLYKLAHRPMAHHLMFMGAPTMDYYYPEFMRTLGQRRPKVIVARIPTDPTGHCPTALSEAIYAQTEATFGPEARVIREHYQVSEIMDDLVLLTPRG